MRPSAYGIYLLHFIPLIWLQYVVYDPAFPAFVKFAIVFTGTLSLSWAFTVLLRKIPFVAQMISPGDPLAASISAASAASSR
jgi:surface polysaccharide O-acyltransferase-like enzyme